uniref:Collagen type XIV alpha 1 chain n=1 Tax=Paramormyrops kingsleyae TaxID=1676925 RepID=A0A3B3QW68_9TELE
MRVHCCLLLFLAHIVLLIAPAQGQVSPPRKLRYTLLSFDKLLVSWKEPRGDFDGYMFVYNAHPDGKVTESQLPKAENKVVIDNFNGGLEYRIKVFAMRGNQRSKPLQGTFTAQDVRPDDGVEPQGLKVASVVEETNRITEGKVAIHWELMTDCVSVSYSPVYTRLGCQLPAASPVRGRGAFCFSHSRSGSPPFAV